MKSSKIKVHKRPIPEKRKLLINGTKLGMFLLGVSISEEDMEQNSQKPVLLFLSGGPGIPEYFLEYEYPTHLEKEFIVCYLEYRGTASSYVSGMAPKTMTTKQYVADVIEVTKYLCKRFKQEKVYLLAHSFGTYIGLNVVDKVPELYYAYFAMSQMCNQPESEILAYDYMLEHYQKIGNKRRVRDFLSYRIKESKADYEKYRVSVTRDVSMHEMGIGTMESMRSIYKDIVFAFSTCPAYSFRERLHIIKGKMFAQKTQVAVEAWSTNEFEHIREVKVPVYFLAGRRDYTCCYKVQKKYFEFLTAPQKNFYTFEKSAHSPLFEENEKALDIIREVIKG